MVEKSPASDLTPPRSWWRRRLVDPVIRLLRQGTSPKELSISLALGAVIGVFPVLGTTTALCLVVAWCFRLNIVAMQIPNYVVYPIQLALIVPFIRFGERLFQSPRLPVGPSDLVELFRAGTLHAIGVLWRSLLQASVAWLLVAPVAAAVLYVVMLPMVRRLAATYAAARERAAARVVSL